MSTHKGGGLLGALGYWAVRALLLAARVLPWRLLRAIGIMAGRLGYLLDARHRAIALESVQRSFPEESSAQHRAVVRGCYRHIGLSAVEFARLAAVPREEIRRLWPLTDEQIRLLTELNAERPAPIFVTGHVGLWEMCGLAYSAQGWRVDSIARPLDNPRINALVDSARERFGQRILAKRGALVAALHALKQGTPVAMLLDQNAGEHGVFVPLFGRLASTLPTAAEIAMRTGSPIVCVTCWRDEANGVHRIRLGRVIRTGQWDGPRDERYRAEVLRITAEYTLNIEDAVREHPEQWLWLHRRWKTRPPQEVAVRSL
jgi:Kdo2-lipid IVA lauroyltransferase/acyltransferase